LSGKTYRFVLIPAFLALCLVGCRTGRVPQNLAWPEVSLTAQDRILILAPHPDDETLACGGIIQQAVALGLPVRVAFLTYGDANEWSFALYRERPVLGSTAVEGMGLVRHGEAISATHTLGLQPDQLTFLGYPDFGTLDIWYAHWSASPPFRGLLTRVTAVPYADALRPGALYKGEEILADLTMVLREFRPTKVFLSHPADGNPDHLALYLFTHVALWDLGAELQPTLYSYLVHYAHWPTPRGYHPTDPLPSPPGLEQTNAWQVHPLSAEETDRKFTALQAHRTQYESNAAYLSSFVRRNELFGDFPVIELGASVPLVSDGIANPGPSEELAATERAAFVGVEWRTVQLDGPDLVIALDYSRPLAQGVKASVYIFGYRVGQPFAGMPKLHVQFGEGSHVIYDQQRELPQDALQVDRQPKQVTIHVPLALLGNPQRVMINARTYLSDVPLDLASWRILELATSP